MQNSTPSQTTATSYREPHREPQYKATGNPLTACSSPTANESLQDILKRLIMREYERQISAK
ncbi:hypothetical protein FACS1894184_03550 [Clostridia bacterium]|nr:hypothetical protein FACS1894184_03550 [Clostridia bacterium]